MRPAPYRRAVHRSEYDLVPDGPRDAEEDPHWTELAPTRPDQVPTSYFPAAMPGEHPPWRRAAAVVLIVMFLSATAGGVCLTYGPGELFALLR